MSNNLAHYFSHSSDMASKAQPLRQDEEHEPDDSMGPSVSMAMEAEDDDEFERSTFNLKRTCSMGLLDEYIDPTRKLLGRSVTSPCISTPGSSTARTSPERASKDERGAVGEIMNGDEEGDSTNERCVGIGELREEEFHTSDARESSPELNDLVPAHIEDSKSPPEPDTDSYMLPLDDIDVHHEPNRHVDYLSHNWEESDVSQSWKYIILKKKQKGEQDLVNAARLENASWRTWAKARNNLRTVSPETVNWSKDSDVTWLYGPIVRNSGVSTSNKLSSVVQEQEDLGYGSGDEASQRVSKKRVEKPSRPVAGNIAGPKPILKKRTVSEIIEENSLWRLTVARQHRKQITDANSIMDGYGHKYQYDDYDALAARVNSQYYVKSNVYNVPAKSPSPLGIPSTQSASTLVPLASNANASPENTQQPALPGSSTGDIDTTAKVPVLASILTSTNSEKDKVKDRHIHFNDRVEQCMAIDHHSDDDDDDNDNEHEEYGYDDYLGDEDLNDEYAPNFTGGHMHADRYGTNSQGDDSSAEEDVDEDEGGLFISATSRKTDNGSHVQTDISSYGSSTIGPGGRYSIPLIIKMLPATTLNYGSDDEFYHNRDYYSGNAVSHNVNTYRGYDYVYDYNSVYTADTSNFLTFQKCDIVDVPEDLRTPVSEELPTPFIFDSTVSSEQPKGSRNAPSVKSPQEQQITETTVGDGYSSLFVSEGIAGSFESSEESASSDNNLVSVEDSNFLTREKSNEGSDSLFLRRTHSLGKCSGSLHDLQYRKSSATQTHNFISGKQIPQKSGGALSRSPALQQQQLQQSQVHSQRPVLVKRSSSKSFIFGDSDSDSESESESYAPVQPAQISHPLSNESNVRSPFSLTTRNTSASTSPKSIPPPNFGSFGSSNSHASLSDVAIPGYISPRHSSMQSVISKEKIINVKNGNASGTNTSEDNDHSESLDLDSVNKTFENYHFDPTPAENCEKFDRSSQSSGRMMEMASKYLNSWKR